MPVQFDDRQLKFSSYSERENLSRMFHIFLIQKDYIMSGEVYEYFKSKLLLLIV